MTPPPPSSPPFTYQGNRATKCHRGAWCPKRLIINDPGLVRTIKKAHKYLLLRIPYFFKSLLNTVYPCMQIDVFNHDIFISYILFCFLFVCCGAGTLQSCRDLSFFSAGVQAEVFGLALGS